MKIFLAATCAFLLAACSPGHPTPQQADETISKFIAAHTVNDAGTQETAEDKGHVTGDVNGDGVDDLALVWLTTGPSYWHYTLTIFTLQDGAYQPAGELALNGQVQKPPVIANGLVTIDQMTYGKNDPICCPSIHAVEAYRLNGKSITEVRP